MDFPTKIFVAIDRSEESEFLSAHDDEQRAIRSTESGLEAEIAVYELVSASRRKIATSVVDA